VISVKAGVSLTLALRDPDEAVRLHAIHALKNLKYENTVEALNEIVKKDDSVFNRKEAFDALKEINSPKAHNALFGALKNSNDEIRWKAIEFAREQKDPKTIPWVKEAMGRTSLKKK
jgi:HEAT repeat protein